MRDIEARLGGSNPDRLLRWVRPFDYFIDQYLRTRGYTLNDDNRRMVGEKLEKFLGRVPFLWDDLNAFLDQGWRT